MMSPASLNAIGQARDLGWVRKESCGDDPEIRRLDRTNKGELTGVMYGGARRWERRAQPSCYTAGRSGIAFSMVTHGLRAAS